MLPNNDYIKFICEEEGQGQKNIFEDQGEPKEFGGTVGDSLTFKSSTAGILVICDIEIEIQVVDLEVEKEIDSALT